MGFYNGILGDLFFDLSKKLVDKNGDSIKTLIIFIYYDKGFAKQKLNNKRDTIFYCNYIFGIIVF